MTRFDFGSLKQVFQKVSHAISAGKEFVSEHSSRIAAALGAHSDFGSSRGYHTVKTIAAVGLLAASAFSLNLEGVLGAGFMAADEIRTLDDVGRSTLAHLHAVPTAHIS